jgi:hypothetical protein
MTLTTLATALLLAQLQPLPPQLIPLDSEPGQRLLLESNARRAYFPLSAQFLTQKTQAFCGVASTVMVLNAMPIQAPIAEEWAPFRAFTQDNVFNPEVRAQLTPEFVNRGGLTLEQLSMLLRGNHLEAQPVGAGESSLERFRDEASRALAQPAHHVLIDFLRTELGQDFGAHWSPLAAYHAGSDRFLVLDVARFRYPPYWATAADLYRAMATRDLDSGKLRGYVLVSPAAGAPPRLEVPQVKHRLLRMAIGAAALLLGIGAALGALAMRFWLRRRAGRSS